MAASETLRRLRALHLPCVRRASPNALPRRSGAKARREPRRRDLANRQRRTTAAGGARRVARTGTPRRGTPPCAYEAPRMCEPDREGATAGSPTRIQLDHPEDARRCSVSSSSLQQRRWRSRRGADQLQSSPTEMTANPAQNGEPGCSQRGARDVRRSSRHSRWPPSSGVILQRAACFGLGRSQALRVPQSRFHSPKPTGSQDHAPSSHHESQIGRRPCQAGGSLRLGHQRVFQTWLLRDQARPSGTTPRASDPQPAVTVREGAARRTCATLCPACTNPKLSASNVAEPA